MFVQHKCRNWPLEQCNLGSHRRFLWPHLRICPLCTCQSLPAYSGHLCQEEHCPILDPWVETQTQKEMEKIRYLSWGALLSSRDKWKIRKGFKLISKQLLKWQVCFFCLYLTEVELSGETKYKRSSEDSFSGVLTHNSLRPLNGSQEMSEMFRWPLQLPRKRKCFDVNIHSAYWRGKTRVIVFSVVVGGFFVEHFLRA